MIDNQIKTDLLSVFIYTMMQLNRITREAAGECVARIRDRVVMSREGINESVTLSSP